MPEVKALLLRDGLEAVGDSPQEFAGRDQSRSREVEESREGRGDQTAMTRAVLRGSECSTD